MLRGAQLSDLCEMSEGIISTLQHVKLNLSHLSISDQELIEIIVPYLNQNPVIKELNLSMEDMAIDGVNLNLIGPKGAAALACVPSLQYINLNCNTIGDEGAKALSEHLSLIALDISYNGVSNIGVKAFESHPAIRVLWVEGKEIDVEIVNSLLSRPQMILLGVNSHGEKGRADLTLFQTDNPTIVCNSARSKGIPLNVPSLYKLCLFAFHEDSEKPAYYRKLPNADQLPDNIQEDLSYLRKF